MTKLGHSVRDGVVYLRSVGSKAATKQLSVPAHIARSIPEGSAFKCEFHEDGLLYRFIGKGQDAGVELPGWVSK